MGNIIDNTASYFINIVTNNFTHIVFEAVVVKVTVTKIIAHFNYYHLLHLSIFLYKSFSFSLNFRKKMDLII